MSHAAPGQLAAYNSLQDKHLSGYFNNGHMKKHLVKSGLITKKGKIIDEKTYRLNMAKKEHRKHVRDLLATAIIHKALDMERTRQYEIRKRLDEVYKVELVRRVKEDRKKKGDEDILPLLTPRERSARRRKHVRPATAPAGLNGTAQPSEIHYDDNTGRLCYTIEGQETAMNTYLKDDEDPNGSPYTRAYPGTYPVPAPPPAGTPRRPRPNSSTLARKRTRPVRFHYLARTEPAVAHRVQLQSMAEVTMKFLGPSLMLTNSLFPEDRLSEVMVLQQHCGGSTLCVFRELLPPNTIFTFVSRRHRGAPFGLTFYIDSLQDIRLSSCCEYKHKPGHILGGRNGHFQFVQVEGAAPCYRCQIASGVRDHRSKDSSEQGEEKENRSKTFLTQDESNQSRESFDVIITKVDPSENESQAGIQRITVETTPSGYKMIIPHSAEKVDGSTQTPRDEKEDTETSNVEDEEKKNNSDVSSAEEKEEEDEEQEDKQDFEDEDKNEEKSVKDSEDEKPEDEKEDSDKEDESKTNEYKDDYKDDFDSDKKESDKESDDETKPDDSDAEDVHDETEKKDDVMEEDKEEEEEVEDETEEKKKEEQEKQEDNDSVHDSDSDMKPSRTVSFDEDVKIITVNEDTEANVEDEVEEQDNKASEQDKPEDIPEVPEDDTDTAITPSKEPEVDDRPDETKTAYKEAEPEVDDSSKDVKAEPEVDGSSDDEPKKESEEPTTTAAENEEDEKDGEVDEKENHRNEIQVEKIENEIETEKKTEEEPEKETKKEIPEESQSDDKGDTGKDEVKDAPVEDSVDDPSVKPDDSLEVVSPEPIEIDSSSDSSSSSSSSSSDSDSDDEKDGVDEPDHDPGKDPDLVAEKLPEQALKVIGVTPGPKHEGSIQPLVEDKKDIELTSLVLDSEQVDELAGIIEKKEDVGSITLRNTQINDESVEKLVEVLKKSSSIKMLNLNVNRVGPQGAQHIADLIRESKSLRMLLLHGNPLQDEGVHHILDAIINTKDTALNNLDLGDCKMKDDGAKDVARLLIHNKTITDLTISGNSIGLSGWRIISSALEQNSTLKSLSLDFSSLGDDESVILAEGIKENKGLRFLDLEGNRIGDEGGKSLLEAVKVNPTIVDLTLMPMNEISKDICDEIKGILEERSKSRVSSASSSIGSLLSRNSPPRPFKDEAGDDSEAGWPRIESLTEDTKKKDEVETSKENEVSSPSVDNENKMEDSIEGARGDEDSAFNETENEETTSEENKAQNDKVESPSEDRKETVDNSNADQNS
ncbi:glutamate-rich protein 3-like isoform X2 [Actinia tenebrosa]|uniref:Glutamate-rich protein 3-like isoform X2 n=1 Tax=Actinia tenebrosa TaxID=6105 RepID=A0A6P8IEK8_ACTTE|nr:glutamate-rich protein 3-like isoform X2 [Actinia tenebrosa]